MFRLVWFSFSVATISWLVAAHPANAEVVYIGISTPGLYELPTEIAQRKGFYKEEGFEPRKVVVRTTLHVPALIAGELDYSTVSGIIGRAAIQGLPVKGVMEWFDRPLHMLIARPEIKKLSDLKGRKVAVSGMGSAPHIVLREAFLHAGMNPDRDVTLAVGGSGDRLSALTAGTVDATPVDVAYIEKAEKLGLVSLLYLGDVVNLRLGGFGVSTEKIRRNPNQIVRMIRSTLKGVRFLKTNRSETLAIMRAYLNVSAPAAEKDLRIFPPLAQRRRLCRQKHARCGNPTRQRTAENLGHIPEDKLMDWRFLKEALEQKRPG